MKDDGQPTADFDTVTETLRWTVLGVFDDFVAAVKKALDDAGIEISFPYRTLTWKGPLPIASEEAKS